MFMFCKDYMRIDSENEADESLVKIDLAGKALNAVEIIIHEFVHFYIPHKMSVNNIMGCYGIEDCHNSLFYYLEELLNSIINACSISISMPTKKIVSKQNIWRVC